MEECRSRYGKRFTLRFLGGREFVFLQDPQDIKALFTSPQEVFRSANSNMRPFFGDNALMLLEGDRHRRHRRLMGPPMHGDRIGAYTAQIHDITLEDLRTWPRSEAVPVLERMQEITLRIIIRVIFGVERASREAEISRLTRVLLSGPTALFAFLTPLQVDFGRYSPWGHFVRLRARLQQLLQMEVHAARESTGNRDDILARMLKEGAQHGDPLSDEEIVDELIVLLASGHETSATALSWAFQWILGSASARSRVIEEVRGVVGQSPLSSQHLENMPFLEASVLETLRRNPIIPIMPRLLAAPAQIGDLWLPQGVYATPCAYLTQHDADVYPNPYGFEPERFLGKKPNPFEWFPFGGGFRFCLGGLFALHEVRAILATIFAHADLRLVDTEPPIPKRQGITLAPAKGTPVVVERQW